MSILKKSKNISFALLSISLMFLLIYKSEVFFNGMKKGLDISINTLIPSLFPFIVLSTFLIVSNIYLSLGSLLKPITVNLLKLPKNLGGLIFLSFIGGFPVGAKNISIVHNNNKIDKTTAEILLSFCVNAGPAFIITGIGSKMLNNQTLGLYLFISQSLASLIVGFIFVRLFNKHKKIVIYKPFDNDEIKNIPNSFCESVDISLKAMASICSFVVAFCCILEFVKTLNLRSDFIKALIFGFLEVTYSSKFLAQNNFSFSLFLICFSLSFCGISVIYQIKSILYENEISLKYFYMSRIPHFLISLFIFNLFMTLSPTSANVFSPSDTITTTLSTTNFYTIISLLFCMLSVFYTIQDKIIKIKSKRL
ncbi:MAG: hypothetical protein ACRCZK_00130 [Oscillospiraceae bacterium]